MQKQIIVFMMGLILMLTGCGGTPAPTPIPVPPTATPQPTSTPVWFPPTATPTRQPTAVHTATPDLRGALGSLLLADDFTNESDWALRQVGDSSAQIANGHLTLALASEKTSLYITRFSPVVGDYYMEIAAAPSLCAGRNEYGLMVRVSPNLDYYRFGLSCDGQVHVDRIYENKAFAIQNWQPLLGLPLSVPGEVALAVHAAGSELRFFVNGVYVFSVRDTVLYQGQVGVYARVVEDSPLTVNFSDLRIYALP